MGYLQGFKRTAKEANKSTIFDFIVSSGRKWILCFSDGSKKTGTVKADNKHDILFEDEEENESKIDKHDIELIYPKALADDIEPRLHVDERIRSKKIEPIIIPKERNHIKNKTVYALLHDKERVTITTLSGLKFSGTFSNFARFELLMAVEPNKPVILLRHAVLKATNSRGTCILQRTQDARKDWERSSVWVREETD